MAVVAMIAGIAIPAVLQARMAANESAAISSLRVIHSAQTAFATSCAAGGYAQSLQDLALPPAGSTHGFISESLTTNGTLKSGYIANVSADPGATIVVPAAATCNSSASPAMSAFFAEGHPQSIGITGQRSFALATGGAIYFRDDGVSIMPGMMGASILR